MAVAVPIESAPSRRPRGPVVVQLRLVLADLRARGMTFEDAWMAAWDLIRWPRSQRETKEWHEALAATKEPWRACYEGWEPLPQEVAVAGLSEALEIVLAEAA